MTHPRTPEIDAEFRRLWHAGERLHDIAKALGMRKTTTYDYRVSLGLTDRPIPGAKNLWKPAQLADVKRRWQEGESAATIAAAFPGRTRAAVIGIVHRQGWQHLGRESVSTPALKAPAVERGVANPRGAHRTAPRPGPQNKPGAVFGKESVVGPAETAKIRIAAQFAGLASIQRSVEQPGPSSVSLLNRRTFQCSWPVGVPDRLANQMCCGEPVPANTHRATPTYCMTHGNRALSKVQPSARISPPRERRAA